jgi:hypothetical protein
MPDISITRCGDGVSVRVSRPVDAGWELERGRPLAQRGRRERSDRGLEKKRAGGATWGATTRERSEAERRESRAQRSSPNGRAAVAAEARSERGLAKKRAGTKEPRTRRSRGPVG